MKIQHFFKSKTYECWFMLSFWLVFFFFFTVVPVCIAIFTSFTNYNMLQPMKWIGIANYLRMFLNDDIFVKSLSNTLLFAVITGPIGYVLSFTIAWFINDFGRRIRSFLTFLFYAPTLVGSVYTIWMYIFSNDSYGMVNSVLLSFGFISEPVMWLSDPTHNVYVVIIVILWMSMGNGFLSFIAGLQQLNRTYFEAAAIDGLKNRWQELWYITLPQMVPQLLLGAVLSISSAFSVGAVNSALTGMPSTDYSTHTLLLHIQDVGGSRLEMGYASAIAVILFVLMIVAWKASYKFINSFIGK